MYLDCVHSAGISRSSAGDRVTASPDSLVLLCGYVRLCFEGKQTCCEKSLPGLLRRFVYSVVSRRCTVTVYITSGAMASGKARGGRPQVDRSRVVRDFMECARVLRDFGLTGSALQRTWGSTSWSTTTGCLVILFRMIPCTGRSC